MNIIDQAKDFGFLIAYPFALRAAVLLNVPNIIHSAGPGAKLSAEEICKHLEHPEGSSPTNLEKILELLTCHGIFTSVVDEKAPATVTKYGLTSKSEFLAGNDIAGGFLMLQTAPELVKMWPYLHQTVTNPDESVAEKVFGKGFYQYLNEDAPEVAKFNVQNMHQVSTIQVNFLVEHYDERFKSLKGTMVDVGGSEGYVSAILAAKYPNVERIINFDLPEVISRAPPIPGVEHVGGSFLEFVPKGDFMLLKFVVSNWNDEQAVKLLRNCFNALPSKGWAVIVDYMLPDSGIQDPEARLRSAAQDLTMTLGFKGVKHRTESQFAKVAFSAGFRYICDWSPGGTLKYLEIRKP